jgi:HEAT repeat protein
MPLVRKPTGQSPAPASDASAVLGNLVRGDADERWAAARAAADVPGAVMPLAAALRHEGDSRVREAMFTSLARIGTSESADLLISFLRSEGANLRAGALDALRIMIGGMRELVPRLLGDDDVDIRILSCELARVLPDPEATTVLCTLLAVEHEVNVCAAAIDVLAEMGGPAALPALAACAQRFRDSPFLGFAIRTATDRIHSQHPSPRA